MTIVPAFGLKALPATARGWMALTLAVAIAPGISMAEGAHAVRLLEELTRGVGIAVAAAVPLWAATMTGGVIDSLRASGDRVSAPVVEGRPTPLGVPLSILASAIFLSTGGASRVIAAVARPEIAANPVVNAAHDLVAGIVLAVALGGPVLARVDRHRDRRRPRGPRRRSRADPFADRASPAFAVLVVLAIGIDRIAEAMALSMR